MNLDNHKTTCSYCGVGCGIIVKKDSRGKISVEGDAEHPVNRGMLCSKGLNLNYTVSDRSDRLLYPQMRWGKNHPLSRVSWDQAMQRAAAVFKSLISRFGPESVGFYVSGQCLTEEYYLVNKLVKGFIGSNNIDTNSRLCMSSAVVAYKKSLGEDAVPISYEDIELADCFFIAGANPAWCHPILFRRIEQHKARNPQVRVVVVDPRKTNSCSLADLHLQINPGTDVVLYNAIARVLIENGDIDKKFIRDHTNGFDELYQKLMRQTLEEASAICDVPVDQIVKAARYIGAAKGFISMWAMGLNQSVVGVQKNLALLNLSLITGQIGKPGSGPFSLTGQPNAMGGREVGGMASLLAAHKDLSNPHHRQEVARFWGVEAISEKPGLTATQMIDALHHGRLKAIWIICTNPMVSLPNSHEAVAAMKKARFVVVQDISNRSDTVKYADLILPAAGWLEKEGTMTNSERRISYLPRVTDPPGECLPDAEIIMRFANEMGYPGFDFDDISQVYAEYARMTRGTNIDISGLDHQRLKKDGTLQWPVPDATHPGTPRLFTDKRFYTPDGKARIHTTGTDSEVQQPDGRYPLILTTGRIRDQWHTMTRTGKVNKLQQHISRPFLEISENDALVREIADEDTVEIFNANGAVRVTAKYSHEIKPGVVFLPMHWGQLMNGDFGRANNLTFAWTDPDSGQPDFKFTRVQVKKYKKPREKVLVVGAGAASFRFVQDYRKKNRFDEIHVFSGEPEPFYNRILLPEYVTDHLSWDELKKIRNRELDDLNITLHCNTLIKSIGTDLKLVVDSRGKTHSYDKLVLATGSRPFVPKEVPVDLPGIFSLRTRADADALKEYLDPGAPVLIVGGGLLGLELAASLKSDNHQVSIVQLNSRLMERQLDPLAGELLKEVVQEMGIAVHFNDQVQRIFSNKDKSGLEARLKSGKLLKCQAAVYAIGTRPNIEMAQAAGLNCKRGVVVDHYLQTSDPDVFAIGEIAEYKDMLYGITASAEQQAEVCASFINGDLSHYYQGSLLMNILKFSNLDLCSMGMVSAPKGDPEYEEILFIDRAQRFYKKCIIHKDRLVGTILMGDKAEFVEFRNMIESQVELSEKRIQLLRSGKTMEPVLGKLVCSCNQVGEGNLLKALDNGCTALEDLNQATGAGLGCGSCKPEVQAIFEQHQVTEPII